MLTITASLSCLPSQASPHACTANSFAFSSFSRLIGRLRTTSLTWIRQRNLNLTAFYFSLKSKVGLIAAKAAALLLRSLVRETLEMSPVVSHARTHSRSHELCSISAADTSIKSPLEPTQPSRPRPSREKMAFAVFRTLPRSEHMNVQHPPLHRLAAKASDSFILKRRRLNRGKCDKKPPGLSNHDTYDDEKLDQDLRD
jgi:hypothetical protein